LELKESYDDLYQMVANSKNPDVRKSVEGHKRYHGGDDDTDFGDGNGGNDGDDGFDDGFNGGGGSGMARRSRRIMQSRYTGFSSSAIKREYGSGFMGA